MASCIAVASTISVRPKSRQTLAASATPFFNSAALRKSFQSLSVSSRSPRSLVVKASELLLVGHVASDFEAEAVFDQEFINVKLILERKLGWELLISLNSRKLDETTKSLETELIQSRTSQTARSKPVLEKTVTASKAKEAFVFIGINTTSSSKKRRDSVRETWMPTESRRFSNRVS